MTLKIGQFVKLKSLEGDQWNMWKIHRQDKDGNLWAKHQQEFSCYETIVTEDDILA